MFVLNKNLPESYKSLKESYYLNLDNNFLLDIIDHLRHKGFNIIYFNKDKNISGIKLLYIDAYLNVLVYHDIDEDEFRHLKKRMRQLYYYDIYYHLMEKSSYQYLSEQMLENHIYRINEKRLIYKKFDRYYYGEINENNHLNIYVEYVNFDEFFKSLSNQFTFEETDINCNDLIVNDDDYKDMMINLLNTKFKRNVFLSKLDNPDTYLLYGDLIIHCIIIKNNEFKGVQVISNDEYKSAKMLTVQQLNVDFYKQIEQRLFETNLINFNKYE